MLAAVSDYAIDDMIESLHGGIELAIMSDRHPERRIKGMLKAKGCVTHQITDAGGDYSIGVMDLAAEERLGGDVQAHPHHFMCNVDRASVSDTGFPVVQHGLGFMADHFAQAVDLMLMKGGLHQSALAQPE